MAKLFGAMRRTDGASARHGRAVRRRSSTMFATSSAWEMPTTWDAPGISTVRRAPARSAMIWCAPAGMLWSSSPNTNQLGTVRHSACSPGGLEQRLLGDGPLRDRHHARACSAGRSAQNCAWYLSWAM